MSGPVIKVRVIRQPALKARMLSQWPARVAVGSVTTGEPGTSAAVENVGTAGSAVLNFTIPRGNGGIVQSLVAGSNITINATDPAHPIINSTASGSGDVVGPSTAVDGTPAVFDGTSGKLLKNITFSAFKTLLSLVKGDVGLGNVDNTSDSTKNAATVTLTNKTLTSPVINGATGSAASSFTATTQAARDNSTKLATTAYVDRTTRELLTANRTYYVRTDGNDSNNGFANTSGGAFLTIQKALTVAAALDCVTFNVTIQVDDGTHTEAVVLPQMLGSGTFTLQGNVGTPANSIISATSAGAITGTDAGSWSVNGFRLQTTTSGSGLLAFGRTSIKFQAIDFGTVAGPHHMNAEGGGRIIASGGWSISGNSTFSHMASSNGGYIEAYSKTITLSGTRAFSIFAFATNASINSGSLTFSGSATGTRYQATLNGVILTNGGGGSYFPGSLAGSVATGGQYA